jgi:hypothetical protein
MDIRHPDAIWLIPPLLAVVFLLWALWNFWKDDRKHRENARAAQPHLLVSTHDRDRSLSRAEARDLRYSRSAAMTRPLERTARG